MFAGTWWLSPAKAGGPGVAFLLRSHTKASLMPDLQDTIRQQ